MRIPTLRRFALLLLLACGFVATSVGPARAAGEADVLQIIPDNCLGFVVVQSDATTSAKLLALGEQIGQPIPDPLAMMNSMAGVEEGLREDGSFALIVATVEGDVARSRPVLAVPVVYLGRRMARSAAA